jgi:hypothetical protein
MLTKSEKKVLEGVIRRGFDFVVLPANSTPDVVLFHFVKNIKTITQYRVFINQVGVKNFTDDNQDYMYLLRKGRGLFFTYRDANKTSSKDKIPIESEGEENEELIEELGGAGDDDVPEIEETPMDALYEQYANFTYHKKNEELANSNCCQAMTIKPKRIIERCKNKRLPGIQFCHPHECQNRNKDNTRLLTIDFMDNMQSYHNQNDKRRNNEFKRKAKTYCETKVGAPPKEYEPREPTIVSVFPEVDPIPFTHVPNEVTDRLCERFIEFKEQMKNANGIDEEKIMKESEKMMSKYKQSLMDLVDVNLSVLFHEISGPKDSSGLIKRLQSLMEAEFAPCDGSAVIDGSPSFSEKDLRFQKKFCDVASPDSVMKDVAAGADVVAAGGGAVGNAARAVAGVFSGGLAPFFANGIFGGGNSNMNNGDGDSNMNDIDAAVSDGSGGGGGGGGDADGGGGANDSAGDAAVDAASVNGVAAAAGVSNGGSNVSRQKAQFESRNNTNTAKVPRPNRRQNRSNQPYTNNR